MGTKVFIAGITGKMGRVVLETFRNKEGFEVVGGIAKEREKLGDVEVVDDLEKIKWDFDVAIDFTHADFSLYFIKKAIEAGKRVVSGTTGFSREDLQNIELLAREKGVPVLIAPNFSIGAVVMMKVCSLVAPYFEDVEIIEYHHKQKRDKPSGTSKLTKDKILESGYAGEIPIHSVRLKGMVAHQDVIFSNDSEILTIRHDSFSRKSFMKGLSMAVEFILLQKSGYFYGLDSVLAFNKEGG